MRWAFFLRPIEDLLNALPFVYPSGDLDTVCGLTAKHTQKLMGSGRPKGPVEGVKAPCSYLSVVHVIRCLFQLIGDLLFVLVGIALQDCPRMMDMAVFRLCLDGIEAATDSWHVETLADFSQRHLPGGSHKGRFHCFLNPLVRIRYHQLDAF